MCRRQKVSRTSDSWVEWRCCLWPTCRSSNGASWEIPFILYWLWFVAGKIIDSPANHVWPCPAFAEFHAQIPQPTLRLSKKGHLCCGIRFKSASHNGTVWSSWNTVEIQKLHIKYIQSIDNKIIIIISTSSVSKCFDLDILHWAKRMKCLSLSSKWKKSLQIARVRFARTNPGWYKPSLPLRMLGSKRVANLCGQLAKRGCICQKVHTPYNELCEVQIGCK